MGVTPPTGLGGMRYAFFNLQGTGSAQDQLLY